MPTPRRTREQAQECVDTFDALLRAGYRRQGMPSIWEELGRRYGITSSAARHRLKTADRDYGLVPEAEEVREAPEPLPRPRVIVRAPSEPTAEGTAIRIVCIGDTHQQPGMSVDRWRWIAKYVCDVQPDMVVHIGDLGEWASVERHSAPGSLDQKRRPAFKADLESVEEALAEFRRHAPGVRFHLVLGNHDWRVMLFEAANAEMEGALWSLFTDVLARYDVRWTDYRKYLFIGGVGFTHVPMTLMERPYSGKTLNPIANELVFSLVFGHTHRHAFLNVPKIGPIRKIEVLNVGSAMPHGYFPPYNASEQGGYSWGIVDLTLQGGHITAHTFIPMTELERRYA